MRGWLSILGAAALVAGCNRTPPERQAVVAAAAAMGGAEKITGTNSVVLEGGGENWNFGQNRTPGGDLPRYEVSNFARRYDFAKGRWRLEQVRTPTFPTGNPAPQRQFLALDGDLAFDVATNGVIVRHPAQIAVQRRAELLHHPLGLMRAALAPDARLANPRKDGANDVVDLTGIDGTTLTVHFDGATKLPVRVVSMIDQPNLGDIPMASEFGDYADAGGLKLPTRYTTTWDGIAVSRITVARTGVNEAVDDLVAPPPVASSTPGAGPANVTVENVAPGVWYLTGQSHHSLLVQFADHLVLVEAPLNEARTLAAIAKARELGAGKPVTMVVPTHHHFDHSAGIRAAIAEGLTILTPTGNRAFFESVASRPHTIVPDALAKAPKPPRIESFDNELTMKDAAMTMVLYTIKDSRHADPFVMAYLPGPRVLFQADAYNPPPPDNPSPVFPFVSNLVANITERGIKVDRVLGAHGTGVPYAQVAAAASANAAPATQ